MLLAVRKSVELTPYIDYSKSVQLSSHQVQTTAAVHPATATTAVSTTLVSLVLLVGVEVCTVNSLDMFTQGARVSIALGAATSLAYIRLLQKKYQLRLYYRAF